MNKRYLTVKTYAKLCNTTIHKIKKLYDNDVLVVNEFAQIEGEFIDTSKYPIQDYSALNDNALKIRF